MRRALPLLILVSSTACLPTEMGVFEALSALGEVGRSGRGVQATEDVITISTDFTIGQALEDAAATVADFWQSQVDCTTVTVDGAQATIDYGTLDDACVFRGRTFAGVTTITVGSTAPGQLEVVHDWDAFSNGEITLTGGATVTWDGTDATRRVQTMHSWTDDEGTVDVMGDHVSAPLEEGVAVLDSGFTLDGTRDWTTEQGDWSLTMEGLELRLIDPAPQTGTIALVAPNDKTLDIAYSRVDDDTIEAVLTGVRGGQRTYHIDRLGRTEAVR